jgi:hypothetical protein
MTKSVRVDAEAEEEIAYAIERYEDERAGLGAESFDELRTAIALEHSAPSAGSRRCTFASSPLCTGIGGPRTGVADSDRSGPHLRALADQAAVEPDVP